jgi:hypothetical protein
MGAVLKITGLLKRKGKIQKNGLALMAKVRED